LKKPAIRERAQNDTAIRYIYAEFATTNRYTENAMPETESSINNVTVNRSTKRFL
jgi:hypothetical protein